MHFDRKQSYIVNLSLVGTLTSFGTVKAEAAARRRGTGQGDPAEGRQGKLLSPARVRDDKAPLTGRIVELASVYGRYGSPRITGMLRNEGWNVNPKRVERIWRQAGPEGAEETAASRQAVAERRQLHPAPAGAKGSRVGVRLRRRPDE
jgi:hypothetical protein